MEGHHQAALFEHVAKMVRLPQPDIAPLQPFSYADGVPPVHVIVTDFGPLELQPGRTDTDQDTDSSDFSDADSQLEIERESRRSSHELEGASVTKHNKNSAQISDRTSNEQAPAKDTRRKSNHMRTVATALRGVRRSQAKDTDSLPHGVKKNGIYVVDVSGVSDYSDDDVTPQAVATDTVKKQKAKKKAKRNRKQEAASSGDRKQQASAGGDRIVPDLQAASQASPPVRKSKSRSHSRTTAADDINDGPTNQSDRNKSSSKNKHKKRSSNRNADSDSDVTLTHEQTSEKSVTDEATGKQRHRQRDRKKSGISDINSKRSKSSTERRKSQHAEELSDALSSDTDRAHRRQRSREGRSRDADKRSSKTRDDRKRASKHRDDDDKKRSSKHRDDDDKKRSSKHRDDDRRRSSEKHTHKSSRRSTSAYDDRRGNKRVTSQSEAESEPVTSTPRDRRHGSKYKTGSRGARHEKDDNPRRRSSDKQKRAAREKDNDRDNKSRGQSDRKSSDRDDKSRRQSDRKSSDRENRRRRSRERKIKESLSRASSVSTLVEFKSGRNMRALPRTCSPHSSQRQRQRKKELLLRLQAEQVEVGRSEEFQRLAQILINNTYLQRRQLGKPSSASSSRLGRYKYPKECKVHLHGEFGAGDNGVALTRLNGNYRSRPNSASSQSRAFYAVDNPHRKAKPKAKAKAADRANDKTRDKSRDKRKSSDIVYVPSENRALESHDSSVADEMSLPPFPADDQSTKTEPIRTSKKYRDDAGDERPTSALEMLYKEGSLKAYVSPRSSQHAPVIAPAAPPSLAYLAAGAPQQPPWFISNAIRSPYDNERLVEAVRRELRVMERR